MSLSRDSPPYRFKVPDDLGLACHPPVFQQLLDYERAFFIAKRNIPSAAGPGRSRLGHADSSVPGID